ncbi:N-acetyltransferase [Erwinia aphidicola]|jgi:putative acetyltransferase|uniref:GNAT family N-acetyltransferase n=1 Tax=Erwinia TaxID=551 RepID=UPI0006645BA1|nr:MULTISPECIES: N-acetyltransferase [Erwinia]KMV72712.1 acetyltransferase [bacteria symbiont BFo1 of Frankliniella occidentalis]VTT28528.1 acetyltransferase [Klebsiella pneumoniae]KYP86642.1 acetyltransferase [bacteria symbiont BFo1 of Frankliniella occidentalis]KYP92207.1 acetyltransferase [bacteria symbiont BFo1 of Frankliniella occidentalis]MBD1376085.1 N-acetyltransferase [Erwinia aphidicola]
MLIRTEIGVDAASIDSLLRRCFPTSAEAELVQQLREDGLLTLGVVATDDEGQVLGYAAFSPVTLAEEDRQWVGLAPLAVDESVRKQGLGKQLIYEGLDTLNEFGYAAVVVLGDPAYYGRYGFEPAARYGLHSRWQESEAAFQVYKLAEDAFSGTEGRIEYSAPFNRL